MPGHLAEGSIAVPYDIGAEPTFGKAQDDLPFHEIREACGPYNCSQVILADYHEALGVSLDVARKLGLVLGGGMWHGSTCGALLAPIVAAGLLDRPEAVPALVERFHQETGALSCPSLVHSPTSCATCIDLGRNLVAQMVVEASSANFTSQNDKMQDFSHRVVTERR